MEKHLEVTMMFNEMIEKGYITQPASFESTEDLRFPGELPYTPSIATYGTHNLPGSDGVLRNAELGHRS